MEDTYVIKLWEKAHYANGQEYYVQTDFLVEHDLYMEIQKKLTTCKNAAMLL
jgi:hypothetical protein